MSKIAAIAFFLLSFSFSMNAQSDTLFIQNWDNGHAIYLLPPGKFQKPPVWTSSDSIIYPPVRSFRKFKFNLKETYLPLTVYKGELVYYDPCDGIFENEWIFNDSAFVHLYYDGPEGMPIAAIEHEDENEIQFRILQFNYEDIEKSLEYYLSVKRMNKEKGLYLFNFENPYDSEDTYSFPVVEQSKLHLLPVLVNDSKYQKYMEFEFPEEPITSEMFK
ncbi:MAG: hypothetical protein RLZZ71_533 [Bacteroidota bacterium]|jgi:hypothetical protein